MSGTQHPTPATFLSDVIRPALQAIGLDSLAAEQLLLGTALQESDLHATVQIGGGPALGYFQMEPSTHNDIWENYLKFHADLADKVRGLAGVADGTPPATNLRTNHRYAAAMTRVHYRRVSAPLPEAGDIQALADYWKEHYNTPAGAGSAAQFVGKWNSFQVAGLFSTTTATA